MLRCTWGIAVSIDSGLISSTNLTLDLCTKEIHGRKSPPVHSPEDRVQIGVSGLLGAMELHNFLHV
jgi:hypothetical protein